MTNTGVKAISNCLLGDPKFKKVSLHFWYNRDLGNPCCETIGGLLKNNKSLESFKLTMGLNKRVDNLGFNSIIYGITENPHKKLKTLWLNFRYTAIDNHCINEIDNLFEEA